MKKTILFFTLFFLFYTLSFGDEYEILKLKKQDFVVKMPKIRKEPLPLKKGLKKNEKAEDLLELACKLMDQKIKEWGVPYPGWKNPHTVKKLKEVIRNYPDTEAAVIAKMRLAAIVGHRWYGKDPEYAQELYSDIEALYPESWFGLYAGYRRIIKNLDDEKAQKGQIKQAITEMKEYLGELRSMDQLENKRQILDYLKSAEPWMFGGSKNSSFLAFGYGAIAKGYCIAGDIDNAKKAYRELSAKFPKTKKNVDNLFIALNKGKCPFVRNKKDERIIY